MSRAGDDGPVVVVTGAAAGIGAAIAEDLGRRGAFVVTVDPGLALDGSLLGDGTELTTAQRIADAGGRARASNASVTDAAAVDALFTGLVEEFGALDAVVNVAGISRPTGFAGGTEDDWRAVLNVHLDGYLNVLRAALPLMAAQGHGRILGVTSGSGWRAADAGAYSCAKRAVAALTWAVGADAPPGVSVNALSPVAATRMVLAALSRQAGAGNTSGRDAATGGVSLGGFPPPEHLGPIGAYLAGPEFAAWARGRIMFSNGAEVAWVAPPRLLEVARSEGPDPLDALLAALAPAVLAPAEIAQASNGGGNPRVGVSAVTAVAAGAASARRAVVVCDVGAWRGALTSALTARGVECVTIADPATGFADVDAQLAGTVGAVGPVDAVVVAVAGDVAPAGRDDPAWRRVLGSHAGITDRIRTDAAWVRAAAAPVTAGDRALRVVTVVDATSAGGRSRAQAAAQLSRAAHPATSDRVDAFAIGVESAAPSSRPTTAALVAHLVSDPGAGALSGAELVVASDWFGLRSHPYAAGSITFGGPDVPGWLDGALRDVVGAGRLRDHEESR